MKNLDFDIFISYSHANNKQKDENGKGWVDYFFEKLQNHFTNVSGSTLKPWLDNEQLACGDTLNKISDHGLENTRFFIPILSPPYLKSKWCRKEFLKFSELINAKNSNDLSTYSRILPIIFYPYTTINLEDKQEEEEFESIKSVLKIGEDHEILYKNFFDEQDSKPRFYDPKGPSFDRLCLEFAQDLEIQLRAINNAKESTTSNAPAIFLGLSSGNSFEERGNLLKELENTRKYKKINYQILPEEGDCDCDTLEKMVSKKFKKRAANLIKSSLTSFHLLDSYYGRTPEDSKLSYLELQYDIAAARAKKKDSRFKCLVYFTETKIKDKRQLKFIKKIEADIEAFPENIIKINSDNIKEINETLISIIKSDKKSMQDESETELSEREHLLLLYNSKDENSELVQQIDDFIFKKEIEVRKPTLSKRKNNIDDSEKHLNDSLEKCNKAIIFFGSNATDEWCNATKIDILKATNSRKKCIGKKAICVTDPEVMTRIRKVRSHDFEAINCEDKNYLEQIDNFLSS